MHGCAADTVPELFRFILLLRADDAVCERLPGRHLQERGDPDLRRLRLSVLHLLNLRNSVHGLHLAVHLLSRDAGLRQSLSERHLQLLPDGAAYGHDKDDSLRLRAVRSALCAVLRCPELNVHGLCNGLRAGGHDVQD
jgi:hypothetical protein